MSTEVPRKNGNTAQLLKRAMDGAHEADAEVELVNLYDRSLNYKGCMSCFACKIKGGKKGICSFKDDQQPIQRNLVYTGIIKVKRICIIVGTTEALAYSIHNLVVQKRNTRSKDRHST